MSPLIWLPLGLLAAAIPIIIHLLHRSRAPRLLFSTLRFLRIAVERTRRRRRVENLFLMVLRALMFFLLAWGALGLPKIRGKGAASILVLLDNSASMTVRYEGRSVLDRARDIGHAVIVPRSGSALLDAAKDQYSLLMTNGPEALKELPWRSELGSLDALLDNTQAVGAKADMIAALSVAGRMFASAPNPNRQLVILSDLQANSWAGALDKAFPPDVQVIVPDLGRDEHHSLAVTEVAAIGGATVAGSPVILRAAVYNAGKQAVENRPVTLAAEGGVVQRKSVSVPPGKTADVLFDPVWDVPGSYTGRVLVEPAGDALTLDNERFFKLEIRERIRALVLRSGEEPGYLDDSYFLVRALDPRRVLGAQARSTIDPVVLDVQEFTETRLGDARIVFLLNVQQMTIAQVDALRRLLARGGAVVFFPGDNVDPSTWQTQFASSYVGDVRQPSLIPTLAGPAKTAGQDRFLPVASADLEHPVLRVFRSLPTSFFAAVHVDKYLPVSTDLEEQSRVLLAMEGNTPFLVERGVGRGKTFFFAVGANRQWSNFPLTTLYPVLLSELVFHVISDEVRLTSYAVGAPVEIVLPGAADSQFEINVTDPSGSITRLERAREGENAVASFRNTFAPGVYAWRTEGAFDRQGSFVVNIESAESELARANRSQVVQTLRGREVRWTGDVKDTKELARSLREDRPLTAAFLFAVLAFALFEVWLANRTRHRAPGAAVVLAGRTTA
ncbi:MAG: BatA and WFA domain-containing protein [Planctomycetota bacterium]